MAARNALLLAAVVLLGAARALPQTIRDLVGAEFNARTIAVSDGDTVDAIPAGEKRAIRLRLDGIDTPETGEPFSQQARALTRVLLFDRNARATGRDVDRYRRLVARVRVDGKDVSLELVRAGLACHDTRYSSDRTLASAEAEARSAGRGFWATGAAKPRCVAINQQVRETRNATPRREATTVSAFRGNTDTHLYHATTCRNFRCRLCTRVFGTEAAARAAGFKPAGDCLGSR